MFNLLDQNIVLPAIDLELVLRRCQQRIRTWAADEAGFADLIRKAFHSTDSPPAWHLRASLLNGGFTIGVDILSGEQLQGIRGAYSSSAADGGKRIFLNADWLRSASSGAIEAVLLEELGHAFDVHLNGAVDTPGDEGAIFSALIREASIPLAEQSQNDHYSLLIDGNQNAVEAAAPVARGTPSLLRALSEDSTYIFGDSVANIFYSSFSDADGDNLKAIAITANASSASEGVWHYSSDSGSNWSAIATTGLSDATALYLSSSTLLSFRPATNFNGTPGKLGIRLIDSSYIGSPVFTTGNNKTFGLIDVGEAASPELADLDADGDLDAFIGNGEGNTLYFENTGSSLVPAFAAAVTNPFGITNVGDEANPELVDLDADGDLDAFIGNREGRTIYFENTGSASVPAFTDAVTNPFGITDIGFVANPVFADIDDDGDLDAFIGEYYGSLVYFQNTGLSTDPAFAGSANLPFGITDIGKYSSPVFADLDDDEDLDALIGASTGNTVYFQNTGSPTVPAFAESANLPFAITDIGDYANPEFADLDGDGDLDALIGASNGGTVYFQNNPSLPSGTSIDLSTNAGDNSFFSEAFTLSTSINAVDDVATISGDMTGTGYQGSEAITGDLDATDLADGLTDSSYFSIESGDEPSNGSASINAESGFWSYTPITDFNGNDSFSVTITDDDGHTSKLSITLTVNDISNVAPVAIGPPIILANAEFGSAASPAGVTVANLFEASFSDGDGDTLKAIAVTANASVAPEDDWQFSADRGNTWTSIARAGLSENSALYLSSTTLLRVRPAANFNGIPGSLTARLIDSSLTLNPPSLTDATSDPFGITNVGLEANPAFADIDADGDLDVFISNRAGSTYYFENTGTSSAPVFAAALIDPFGITNVDIYASPEFADLDGDGDLDAFIGNVYGDTYYFQNTGNSAAPAFAAALTNPFGITNVDFKATPEFVDLDADGDLDAFIGHDEGNTIYFENTGSSTNPAFATASTNPFAITSVGDAESYPHASPTFADLDADGDLDAFIGNGEGNTLYFENTGSNVAPAFASALTNAFGITDVGRYAAHPVFADLDADGDLDAFIGNRAGQIIYYQNQSNPFSSGDNIDVSINGGHSAYSEASLNLSTIHSALIPESFPQDSLEIIKQDGFLPILGTDFSSGPNSGDGGNRFESPEFVAVDFANIRFNSYPWSSMLQKAGVPEDEASQIVQSSQEFSERRYAAIRSLYGPDCSNPYTCYESAPAQTADVVVTVIRPRITSAIVSQPIQLFLEERAGIGIFGVQDIPSSGKEMFVIDLRDMPEDTVFNTYADYSIVLGKEGIVGGTGYNLDWTQPEPEPQIDTTPPTLSSAVAGRWDPALIDGSTLTITLDETLAPTVPDTRNFIVRKGRNLNSLKRLKVNSASVDTVANTVTLELVSAVQAADSVTLAYKDKPGDQTSGVIEDAAGNDLGSIGSFSILNNTADDDADNDENPETDQIDSTTGENQQPLISIVGFPVVGQRISASIAISDADGNGAKPRFKWQLSTDGKNWKTAGSKQSLKIAPKHLDQLLRLQMRYQNIEGFKVKERIDVGEVRSGFLLPVAEDQATRTKLSLPFKIGKVKIRSVLMGTPKQDRLTGANKSEMITGDLMKDVLAGGRGEKADVFLLTTDQLDHNNADLIKDFNSQQGDLIALDLKAFPRGSKTKFKAVSNRKQLSKLAVSRNELIYNKKNGNLYFNANRKADGFGSDGGLLAVFKGEPTIHKSCFEYLELLVPNDFGV